MNTILLVGAGGAIGSIFRYGLSLLVGLRSWPYATFTTNIVGCLFIGILFGLGLKQNVTDPYWKFAGIGICGGFTTFSAFSLEGVELLQQQRFGALFLYISLSVTLGLCATYLGYLIAK